MSSRGYALARAELIRVLTAYSGITTGDGLVGGTTLVDTNLIDNAYISPSGIPEKAVLIESGNARGEDKGAATFNNVTGTITLQGTGFSAQIMAGTIYRILNISSVEIDVATINTKIGTNVDAAGTTTLFAWLAKISAQGGQGLVYYGEVTAVDLVTQFRVAGLAGFGDAYFANTYRVYVVRDAAGLGAAPQGEMQLCTAYTSVGGILTHPVFTAGLAVGDEVLLLHERIAEIADLLADIGDASGSTLGSILGILGDPAQSFLAMIGYEGATALANKLTAARAALLDEITALRMAELDAANIPADIDTLLTRLSAARAALLDEITALRMAELDAANIPADIDALLTRLSAVRAGYLDELDFDLQGALAAIAGYLDTEIAAILAAVDTEVAAIETKLDTPANFMANLTTLETRLSAIRAGYLDELDFDLQGTLATIAGYIDAEIAAIITSQGRQLFTMDFWSAGLEEVQIDAAGATVALPDITVADLPAGAAIVRAAVMFKFRMIENTYAGVNKLDGATVALTSQVIQIRSDAPTAYVDAILFIDDFFTLADSVREGGDVIIGTEDVAATVDENDTYNLRYLLGKADSDFINFNDCQVGLRIWYSL